MPYTPSPARYERMAFQPLRPLRAEAAGDLARAVAQFRRDKSRNSKRAISARRSISASPISTSPTITARRRARRRITFGDILRGDFRGYRDEIIISTKAGYRMWPGPYGEWGSRKYLLASLDQSLKRWGSTMSTSSIRTARSRNATRRNDGRALPRCGRARRSMSAFHPTIRAHAEAAAFLERLGTPCLIHQPSYSMLNRWIEDD